jgi:hypothetical protein
MLKKSLKYSSVIFVFVLFVIYGVKSINPFSPLVGKYQFDRSHGYGPITGFQFFSNNTFFHYTNSTSTGNTLNSKKGKYIKYGINFYELLPSGNVEGRLFLVHDTISSVIIIGSSNIENTMVTKKLHRTSF